MDSEEERGDTQVEMENSREEALSREHEDKRSVLVMLDMRRL